LRFIQIGTGPIGGTYFPLGGLIANAISNPPGSQPCERGGSCGVPGVIAVAQSTTGSASNIIAVAQGREDFALAQADLAYWAYSGQGPYAKQGALSDLRAVAMLFQEKIHRVVRKDAGIASITDLKGKRVSLGEDGSGTLIDATLILKGYGLKPSEMTIRPMAPGLAVDELQRGALDAFFFVAGPPVAALGGLARDKELMLLPLDGPVAASLVKEHPFLTRSVIAAGTYPGVPETPTFGVGAVLICSSTTSAELVEGVTRALLHPNSLTLIHRGHPAGTQITPATAAVSLGLPLHDGAVAYYRKAGLLPDPAAEN
jgi:TRAP transporter TAXI family solute receptor